eukprot:9106051-Alexandrium_andersonii.AAC.1
MSASLVGSEMCIRDRRAGVRVPGARARARACMRGCVGAWVRGCVGARAVSYTHLTLPTICSV